MAEPALETYTCECGQTRVRVTDQAPFPCLACEAYSIVRAGEPIDRAEFERLLLRAGRVHSPALLAEAYYENVIDDGTVAACAGPAWCDAEFPDLALDWGTWRELFDVAGYTAQDSPESDR